MKITVYVVSTCIPEAGETEPCLPSVFGTRAEAEAFADTSLRSEWEINAPWNDEEVEADPSVAYAQLLYPDDWRKAVEMLLASNGEGSWGEWELTSHQVEIPGPTLEWESDDENDEHEADCLIGSYRLVGNGETYNLLVTSVSGQQLYQSLIAESIESLDEGKTIAALNFAARVADAWNPA